MYIGNCIICTKRYTANCKPLFGKETHSKLLLLKLVKASSLLSVLFVSSSHFDQNPNHTLLEYTLTKVFFKSSPALCF